MAVEKWVPLCRFLHVSGRLVQSVHIPDARATIACRHQHVPDGWSQSPVAVTRSEKSTRGKPPTADRAGIDCPHTEKLEEAG